MPILDDIMDHDLFGPILWQGMEKGREEGSQTGKNQEALAIVSRQLTPPLRNSSGRSKR
jgi:hypothetical protein